MGMPGVLPVVNKEAVRKAVVAGMMCGCEIAKFSKFDRKSYGDQRSNKALFFGGRAFSFVGSRGVLALLFGGNGVGHILAEQLAYGLLVLTPAADGAGIGIRRRAVGIGAGTEHLAFRADLHVRFDSDHGFVHRHEVFSGENEVSRAVSCPAQRRSGRQAVRGFRHIVLI
jgi:hypothetical protein